MREWFTRNDITARIHDDIAGAEHCFAGTLV